jgi:SNF2 family DNA or RNA helicase
MLELLKPYLEIKGYNCEILTGSQSSTLRNQAITRFNDHETDVFLISTKAGGVGINLVAATEIVIYDSDWNPQNDIQAIARAHRIGQKKEVNVYRLIIANSYESEMFQMSSKKLGLDKAIFTGDTFKSMGDFDEAEKQLTKDEIEMLLKKGLIGFLDNQMN